MANGYINIPGLGSGGGTWKDPVADFASLPGSGNDPGDARVTLDTSDIYIWDGAAWVIDSAADAQAIYRNNTQPPTTDITWDGNALLDVLYINSDAAFPASAGVLRLGNNESVSWRNFADSSDFSLVLNASDNFVLNSNLSMSTKKISDVNEILIDGVFADFGGAMSIPNNKGIIWSNFAQNNAAAIYLNADDEFFFSTGFPLKIGELRQQGSPIAATGFIKLGNDASIVWRNAANSADSVFKFTTSDEFDMNSYPLNIGAHLQMLATNAVRSAPPLFFQKLYFKGDANLYSLDNSNVERQISGAGANFPLTSPTANPSSTGQLRLANNEIIGWRNNANSGDITLYVGTDDSLYLNSNLIMSSFIQAAQHATPANPPALSNKLYFKADDNLYTLDSAGTESQLATAAGSANTALSNLASVAINIPLKGVDGTSALPAYAFTSDSSAGMWYDLAKDQVTFSNGTWTQLRLLPGTNNILLPASGGNPGAYYGDPDVASSNWNFVGNASGYLSVVSATGLDLVQIGFGTPLSVTPAMTLSSTSLNFLIGNVSQANITSAGLIASAAPLARFPIFQGSSASAGNIELSSTSHATKGYVKIKDGSVSTVDPSGFDSSLSAFSTALGGSYSQTISSSNSYAIGMVHAANTVFANGVDAYRSRGTFGAPAQLNNNDFITAFEGIPWDGTGTFSSGMASFKGYTAMFFSASQNHTTTAMGTSIFFNLTEKDTVNIMAPLAITYQGLVIAPDNGTANVIKWSTDNVGAIGTGSKDPNIIYSGTSGISSRGDIKITTAGKGLQIKEGANAKMGVASLVAGTVTVSTTAVTANSRIFLTKQESGTPVALGSVRVSARTAATSFDISSDNALDTSDVAWMIVEPL